MDDPPITRPSLLIRVRDVADSEAWQQFVDVYGPLIFRFARKRGLQDSDAADLTQIVFQAVATGVKRLDYDPRQGSFRGWLLGVVRRQLYKFLARQKRSAPGSGATHARELLEQQPCREPDEAALWNHEYQRQLFSWAAEKVRPGFEESTWQAFWQTAVEGKAVTETARALGMTAGAIYTAKSRVLDRIRKEIQQLQGG